MSSSTAERTFTVREEAAESQASLVWLQPVSLNQTVEDGTVMPIKFTLRDGRDCDFVRDTSIVVAIYEAGVSGSSANPSFYTYSRSGADSRRYGIDGKEYALKFTTAKGEHRYRIEIYQSLTSDGKKLQLLGSKELNAKTKVSGGYSDCRDRDDDDDDNDYRWRR